MSIYNFGNSFSFVDTHRSNNPVLGANELNPIIETHPWAIAQNSDVEDKFHVEGNEQSESSDVADFLSPGFRYLDEAMKMFWSDIRIPTKDSYRFMRTKIAGASKSLQIWRDDLQHARVKLPVMSISRTDHEFYPDKFSPPYLPLQTVPLNRSMTKIRNLYRPVPYNVTYTLVVWAEHKRDAEYAMFQIMPRFNPLAEFVAHDGRIHGTVTNHLLGVSDVSDKEAVAEQKAKVRYDVRVKSEAWLSLPEKVVPTILGTVKVDTISNSIGDIYANIYKKQ